MSNSRTLTQDEFLAEVRDRFGDDPMAWAFQCPNCNTITTGADFKAALIAHPTPNRTTGEPLTASDLLGQECIGRRAEGVGCDWAAYGLFRGPWTVTVPDGGMPIYTFPFAPAPHGKVTADV